jgi:hypothetical protein
MLLGFSKGVAYILVISLIPFGIWKYSIPAGAFGSNVNSLEVSS